MSVEDLLTDNVYAFELHEELVRSSECDSWKEIPVKVDAVSETTGSAEQMTTDDDHKQSDDASDAAVAEPAAAAAAAAPAHQHQSQSQLLGNCPHSLAFLVHGQVTIIFVVSVCLFVCLFVQSFSQPSLIRFRSN